jgi:tetraacyldisaccharide 4'-kinase
MNPERLREKVRKNIFGRAFLLALSWVYGAAVIVRPLLYRVKIFKSKKLQAKVVCVGNLTTGGTGKTPAVILLAQALRQKNLSVAILSRGYGRLGGDGKPTVLLGDTPPPWTESGDEPWMMHHSLKGLKIPILVDSNRIRSGEQAVTFYQSDVLILDDGFQHLKVQHDIDIVLINATDPFGGNRLLPAGNLREPRTALSRASLVLITHADRVSREELKAVRERISAIKPGLPVVEAAHRADFVLDIKTAAKHPVSYIKNERVVALSALGDPSSFESELERIGVEIAQKWRYPDHHPYVIEEMVSIERLRNGMPLVTTLKDCARLPEGWQDVLTAPAYALAIKLEILSGQKAWSAVIADIAAKLK